MKTEFKYLGHIFNDKGCQLDKDRVNSVKNLKEPTNVKELQSILGMYNYMRDFIPNMADLTAPLRILLKRNVAWHWTSVQQKSFDDLRNVISSPPILKNFNPNEEVTIQTDSSQYGIGCSLFQNKRPVAFASKSLTDTEKKYPQIEKEALAIKFACRKFHNYIYGKKITVHTDHLPLVSIFKKNIADIISERIQLSRNVTIVKNTKVLNPKNLSCLTSHQRDHFREYVWISCTLKTKNTLLL